MIRLSVLCLVTIVLIDVTRKIGAADKGSYCGSQWHSRNGVCFYASDYREYTLSTAVERCNRINGKVLSSQADQIKSLQISGNALVWLDLYRRTAGDSPGWYWGNGQRFEPSILKWNKGDESPYLFTFFGLSTQGTLVQRDGSGLNGYICEMKTANETCPTDFKRVGSDCFLVSDLTDVTDLKYYWSSTSGCREKSKGAKLLEIETEEKMRTVNSLITVKSSRLWWIGLKYYGEGNQWRWASQTTPFATIGSYLELANEPDNLGGEENCAAMYTKTLRLADVPCVNFKTIALCTKQDRIPTFSPFTGKFGCGNEGGIRGNMSCYLPLEKYQSWDDARADCQAVGGDLMDIRTSIELTWLMSFLLHKKVWTGLCYTNGAWRWTDGTAADNQSLKWDTSPSQEATSSDGSYCAILSRGYLVDQPRNTMYRAACKRRLYPTTATTG